MKGMGIGMGKEGKKEGREKGGEEEGGGGRRGRWEGEEGGGSGRGRREGEEVFHINPLNWPLPLSPPTQCTYHTTYRLPSTVHYTHTTLPPSHHTLYTYHTPSLPPYTIHIPSHHILYTYPFAIIALQNVHGWLSQCLVSGIPTQVQKGTVHIL